MALFDAEVRHHGRTLVVSMRGELDLASAPQLQHALQHDDDQRRLAIDLRKLDFIDSTGLRAILDAHAQTRSDGVQLALVPGPPAVQRPFDVSGLTPLLRWIEP